MREGLRRWAAPIRLAKCGRLAAVLLAAVAMLGWSPSTVAGCSGGRLGDPGPEIGPAVVFTGTVVRRAEPFTLGVESSLDSIEWTFAVDAVQVGPPSPRITVSSPRMSASCGIEFELGQRYAVRAERGEDGSFEAISDEANLIEPLANAPAVEGSFETAFDWSPILGGGAVVLALVVSAIAFGATRRRSATADGDPT